MRAGMRPFAAMMLMGKFPNKHLGRDHAHRCFSLLYREVDAMAKAWSRSKDDLRFIFKNQSSFCTFLAMSTL